MHPLILFVCLTEMIIDYLNIVLYAYWACCIICETMFVLAGLRLTFNVHVVVTKGRPTSDVWLGCKGVVDSGRWEWVPNHACKFRTGFQKVTKYIICLFYWVLNLYFIRLKLVPKYVFFSVFLFCFSYVKFIYFWACLKVSLFTIAIFKIEFPYIFYKNFMIGSM